MKSLYGIIKLGPKKQLAIQLFNKKDDFHQISLKLGVKLPTAEVYVIDGIAAGMPVEVKTAAELLQVDCEAFDAIKSFAHKAASLREIKDAFQDIFSYNQIRFVIACAIRGYVML